MHHKSVEESLRDLNTSTKGLSEEEVQKRVSIHGKNTLEEERESRIRVFIRQFTSPFILILFAAGLIAFLLGDVKDGLLVYGIVLINGLLGFYQELKAIASIEALKSLTALKTKVVRDGKEVEVDSRDLVPGGHSAFG